MMGMPHHDSAILEGERLVVIGASAGGLDAMKILLSGLSSDFPIPIIYITHLSSKYASHLDEVLDAETLLKVVPAVDGSKLKPGYVYVSVPRKDIHVMEAGIRLLPRGKDERFCPSIDVTFRTAANDYGTRLIAVLMTGRLDDGVSGLNRVFERGGKSIVQCPYDAAFSSMPSEAIARDHPTYIEPLSEIAIRLEDLANCQPRRRNYQLLA